MAGMTLEELENYLEELIIQENYEEAYKEVTQSLVHHPESTAARKLRRTLRKSLKATEQIKKTKQ